MNRRRFLEFPAPIVLSRPPPARAVAAYGFHHRSETVPRHLRALDNTHSTKAVQQ